MLLMGSRKEPAYCKDEASLVAAAAKISLSLRSSSWAYAKATPSL